MYQANPNFVKKCKLHNQECVAIDIRVTCDESRHLCVKCLSNPNKFWGSVISYTEAISSLNQKKKVFKCEREIINQKNIGTLIKLVQGIKQLKQQYDKLFDEIQLIVESQLVQIKEDQSQLEKSLQTIDLDQFLSESHMMTSKQFEGFQKLCQIQFEQMVQKQNIARCLEELQNIDNTIVTLAPYEQNAPQVTLRKKYKLSLICPEHNEKISLFNLNESVARENRLVCQECISGKPGAVYTFKDLYEKWEIYQSLKKELTIANFESKKQKICLIEAEWKKFEQDIIKLINENSQQILSKQKQLLQVNQESNLFNRSWASFTKEDILSIIELLSQPDHLENLKKTSKQELDESNNELDGVVHQQLSMIEDIKKSYMNNLGQLISLENQEPISMISTQINQTVQSQISFQQHHILDINYLSRNKQKVSTPRKYKSAFVFISNQNKFRTYIQEDGQAHFIKQNVNVVEIGYLAAKNNKLIQNLGLLQLSKMKTVSQTTFLSQKSQTSPNFSQKGLILCISYGQQKNITPLNADIPTQQQLSTGNINYQLINQNKVQQTQYCAALAINKEQTIMIAGCNNMIRVFDFKKGSFQDRDLLKCHSDSVFVLLFMANKNDFLSGSKDKSIAIWSINDENKYYCSQELKNAHYSDINCIVIKSNEDLFISCSSDKSIKFWIKNEQWECLQSLVRHTNSVQSLSLNASQNLLISCGDDKSILVIQQRDDRKWEVIQNISLQKQGFRLCFIGDNYISFQPFNHCFMEIYEFNLEKRQFSTKKRIVNVGKGTLCLNLFPQIYNLPKELLISKNGEALNVIKVFNTGEMEFVQSITFGHHYLRGTLTEDGEYLVTWDFDSKQFQVRKYQN